VKVQIITWITFILLDHRHSRNYGQSRGYRDSYDYQSHGQRYDQHYYDDSHSYGTRGQGDRRFYDDDSDYDGQSGYRDFSRPGRGNYHDSRGGYGGYRGRDNYYDDRQHTERDYQSRYTQRADGRRDQPNTYSSQSYATSADHLSTTDELL